MNELLGICISDMWRLGSGAVGAVGIIPLALEARQITKTGKGWGVYPVFVETPIYQGVEKETYFMHPYLLQKRTENRMKKLKEILDQFLRDIVPYHREMELELEDTWSAMVGAVCIVKGKLEQKEDKQNE